MQSIDILLVNPGASQKIYQDLAHKYAAIEPPTWALLIAGALRRQFNVEILDCDAERLSYEQAVSRIKDVNPRLVCFVVYGQNPNSGTTSMEGVYGVAKLLKEDSNLPICVIGSHASALPTEVLNEDFIDFVFINEGVKGLKFLLSTDLKTDLHKVPALGWKEKNKGRLNNGANSLCVDLDNDMPEYPWELLPDRKLYRAHVWHPEFDEGRRNPFASIYTSLGCKFRCDFCLINIVNRTNTDDRTVSAHSNTMRFWSPDKVLTWIDRLVDEGIYTIRLSDEMFFLDKRYFEPILQGIIDRGYGDKLCMWAYSRVDTARPQYLELFRKAGIKWLALGIEAANQAIRKEVTKGTFKETNIRDIVQEIRDAGINVIANYIFGFPDDTHETMQQTLDLALELNTEMVNMYACMALPGSPLYYQAKDAGMEFPKSFAGYGFLSEECVPMSTKYLTAPEVLRFRDEAWLKYFTNPAYLNLVENKFGLQQRLNVEEMSKIQIKRKIYGH